MNSRPKDEILVFAGTLCRARVHHRHRKSERHLEGGSARPHSVPLYFKPTALTSVGRTKACLLGARHLEAKGGYSGVCSERKTPSPTVRIPPGEGGGGGSGHTVGLADWPILADRSDFTTEVQTILGLGRTSLPAARRNCTPRCLTGKLIHSKAFRQRNLLHITISPVLLCSNFHSSSRL